MLIKHVHDVNVEDEYITVEKDETIDTIAKKFDESYVYDTKSHDQMHIPVLSAYVIEKGQPIGIVTKDDIISEVVVKGKDPKKLKAKDIMREPICFSFNEKVQDAINVIIDKGLLTVGVCDGKKLVNVISVYDAFFLYHEVEDI